jgi:hypothetical protein
MRKRGKNLGVENINTSPIANPSLSPNKELIIEMI